MLKKLFVSTLIAVSPLVALASVDFDGIAPIVFDNGNGWESSVDGDAGDIVQAKAIIDVTSDDDVNAISWDFIGDFLPKECVQFGEVTQSVSDLPIEFDIKLPSTVGSHDLQLKVYGVNGAGRDFNCTNDVDTINVNDRLVVNIGNTNTSGNSGGGSSTGGSTVESAPAWLSVLLAQIQANMAALIAALKPVTPPTPPTGGTGSLCSMIPYGNTFALQAFLMANGHAGPFNAIGVYAPTGFRGPITEQALSNFRAQNSCWN